MVYDQGNKENLDKDESDIPYEIDKDVMRVAENEIVDEINECR